MSKNKTKKETLDQKQDIAYWLDRINSQLERIVLCQEKRLSGKSFPDYDSKEDLKSKED